MRLGSLVIYRARLLAAATVMVIASGVRRRRERRLLRRTRSRTGTAIAVNTLLAFPPPAGGAPPALQVNLAMVQGAVYDAVNAIEPKHQPYLLETRFAPDCFEGGRRRNRGLPRPLEHRLDGARRRIPFPNQADLQQALDDGVQQLARGGTGRSSKAEGSPRAKPRPTR